MTENTQDKNDSGSSPVGRGGAGVYIEGELGAFYLLAMLARAEPRGLPGNQFECVRFQGVEEGFALDDIVIHGNTEAGPSLLEIQSKRTVRFSPKDSVFEEVCQQIATAAVSSELSDDRHQLAVATQRTSYKISGPYQDVLSWSRAVNTSAAFFNRLNAKGVASPDMREFVNSFRTNLVAAGIDDDDDVIWRIIRRFQILEFDFESSAPLVRTYVLDRARLVLAQQDNAKADVLWSTLIEIALETAKAGGSLDRETLRKKIVDKGLRFAGDLEFAVARTKVDEMARHALAEIGETVAHIHVPRTTAVAAVTEARDKHRYLEIRGGPGVGKSAVLRHVADQVLREARAIVLDPLRTPAGGWAQVALVLGVTSTAREFLNDLASSGGGVLFIDSLEMFIDPSQRITVNDILREVAKIDGFSVIVTARTEFDRDEANWLDDDARSVLGYGEPVNVGDLSEDEIAYLKEQAPELRTLLWTGHPAAAVARNLYRLSRLLMVKDAAGVRTEAALAEHWWRTGDGEIDGDVRARQRILASLADTALAGQDRIELSEDSDARTQLLASLSLSEPRRDQFTFYHDVLRDWAVGMRIHEAPDLCDSINLSRPAPPNLARGIEMAGRLALERSEDGAEWLSLLERLSPEGSHGSWRRNALLAIVRSELSLNLLNKLSFSLLINGGALLVEITGAIVAIDTLPLKDLIDTVPLESGQDTPGLPESLRGAVTLAAPLVLSWCVSHIDEIPLQALVGVVKLVEVFLYFPATMPTLIGPVAKMLHHWLMRLDCRDVQDVISSDPNAEPLSHREVNRLTENLRQLFLSIAAHAPGELRTYLAAIDPDREYRKVNEIRRFSQTFASAAPKELAVLVENSLLQGTDRKEDLRNGRERAFNLSDTSYLPPSPAQGPFLDLLEKSPDVGLRLIRRLTSHALSFHTGNCEPSDNGFTLKFETNSRFFPCEESYYWSRGEAQNYSVASGLMALEAWGHARLDAGEDVDNVLADVLGPEGSCAAYLLTAIDLLLSHWPKTRKAMVPFVSCPALLAAERGRQARERLNMSAIDLNQEPYGRVRLEDLRKRPSRTTTLEDALPYFAVDDEESQTVHAYLIEAVKRLGPFSDHADFGDAAFMGFHAANMTDPTNWVTVGSERRYNPPQSEVDHITKLDKARAAVVREANISSIVNLATLDRAQSSADVARQLVEFAAGNLPEDTDTDYLKSRSTQLAAIAMIAARDGDEALLGAHHRWIRAVIERTLDEAIEPSHYRHERLDHNRLGLATSALIHLWHRQRNDPDRGTLLAIAARKNPSAAPAFAEALDELIATDPRFPKAVLRVALGTRRAHWHRWDVDKARIEELEQEYADLQKRMIDAEVAWLNGGVEPAWPEFVDRQPLVRRGITIPPDRANALDEDTNEAPHGDIEAEPEIEMYVDANAAAVWLGAITGEHKAEIESWLPDIVETYAGWTVRANGHGLPAEAEIDHEPTEWNLKFYDIAVRVILDAPENRFSQFLSELERLPDQSFCDVAVILLRSLDLLFFNFSPRSDNRAERVRSAVVGRTMAMREWSYRPRRGDHSIESHFGPLVGTLFFNSHNPFAVTRTYLVPAVFERVDTMLDTLRPLLTGGPTTFIALCTMNTLMVSPCARHADFLLTAVDAWLERLPTDKSLWIDIGIGRRVVEWLEAAAADDTALLSDGHPLKSKIEQILDRLVVLGVSEAYELERKM
ncbi:hypothetical protein [Pelagibius sp.]|uniref:hypothetical protein n=1 Tax=Pelagibius sp. TaxID=1931238 RepID=UPI002601E004|nr:hypothetical protein [Pelagibius sp.]